MGDIYAGGHTKMVPSFFNIYLQIYLICMLHGRPFSLIFANFAPKSYWVILQDGMFNIN